MRSGAVNFRGVYAKVDLEKEELAFMPLTTSVSLKKVGTEFAFNVGVVSSMYQHAVSGVGSHVLLTSGLRLPKSPSKATSVAATKDDIEST